MGERPDTAGDDAAFLLNPPNLASLNLPKFGVPFLTLKAEWFIIKKYVGPARQKTSGLKSGPGPANKTEDYTGG